MGSQASEVTHFEWPFSASPMALPAFGSHSRTCKGLVSRVESNASEKDSHMAIVPTRRETAFHPLPFDAEHPAFVPGQRVRRRLGEEVPEPGVAVARAGREEVPGWGEGCTQNRRRVA